MKNYVLGFYIDFDSRRVVLISKTHGPGAMAGKLNGVGGLIEKNESVLVAMMREFKEETGVLVTTNRWIKFAVFHGANTAFEWIVHCFVAYGNIDMCTTITDEVVGKYLITDIINNSIVDSLGNRLELMENLPWLIPMIDSKKLDSVAFYDIAYMR